MTTRNISAGSQEIIQLGYEFYGTFEIMSVALKYSPSFSLNTGKNNVKFSVIVINSEQCQLIGESRHNFFEEKKQIKLEQIKQIKNDCNFIGRYKKYRKISQQRKNIACMASVKLWRTLWRGGGDSGGSRISDTFSIQLVNAPFVGGTIRYTQKLNKCHIQIGRR